MPEPEYTAVVVRDILAHTNGISIARKTDERLEYLSPAYEWVEDDNPDWDSPPVFAEFPDAVWAAVTDMIKGL